MAHEGYHLVCVHPFHNYSKGQLIDDHAEIERLLPDKEHNFVRVYAPNAGNPVPDEAAAIEEPPVPVEPAS